MPGKIKGLYRWCCKVTNGYDGLEVTDMTSSWKNGLALCALINRFRPDLVDFYSLSPDNVYQNNDFAFTVAEREFGIPKLLDPVDMVNMTAPDRLSVATYLAEFYEHFQDQTMFDPPEMPPGWPECVPVLSKPEICNIIEQGSIQHVENGGEQNSNDKTEHEAVAATFLSCVEKSDRKESEIQKPDKDIESRKDDIDDDIDELYIDNLELMKDDTFGEKTFNQACRDEIEDIRSSKKGAVLHAIVYAGITAVAATSVGDSIESDDKSKVETIENMICEGDVQENSEDTVGDNIETDDNKKNELDEKVHNNSEVLMSENMIYGDDVKEQSEEADSASVENEDLEMVSGDLEDISKRPIYARSDSGFGTANTEVLKETMKELTFNQEQPDAEIENTSRKMSLEVSNTCTQETVEMLNNELNKGDIELINVDVIESQSTDTDTDNTENQNLEKISSNSSSSSSDSESMTVGSFATELVENIFHEVQSNPGLIAVITNDLPSIVKEVESGIDVGTELNLDIPKNIEVEIKFIHCEIQMDIPAIETKILEADIRTHNENLTCSRTESFSHSENEDVEMGRTSESVLNENLTRTNLEDRSIADDGSEEALLQDNECISRSSSSDTEEETDEKEPGMKLSVGAILSTEAGEKVLQETVLPYEENDSRISVSSRSHSSSDSEVEPFVHQGCDIIIEAFSSIEVPKTKPDSLQSEFISNEAEQPDLTQNENVNKESKETQSNSLSSLISSSSSNDEEEEPPKVIAPQVSVVVLEKRVAEILTIKDDTVMDSRRSSSSSASSKSPSGSENDVERPDTSHDQYVSDEVKPTVVQEVSDEAEQPDLAEDEIVNKELKETPSKSLSRSTSSSSSNDEEEEPPIVTAPQVSVVVLENRVSELLIIKDDTVEDSRRSLSSSASSKSPALSESDVERPDTSHGQYISDEVEPPVIQDVFYEAEQPDLAEDVIVNKELKEMPSKSLSSSTSFSISNDEEEAPKVIAPQVSVVVLEKRVSELLTIKDDTVVDSRRSSASSRSSSSSESDVERPDIPHCQYVSDEVKPTVVQEVSVEAEQPDLAEDEIVNKEMKETPPKSLSWSTSSSSYNDEEEEAPEVTAPQVSVVVLENRVPEILTKDCTVEDSKRSLSSSASSKSPSMSESGVERPDTSHGPYISDELEPPVVQEVFYEAKQPDLAEDEIVNKEMKKMPSKSLFSSTSSSSSNDEEEVPKVIASNVSAVVLEKRVAEILTIKDDTVVDSRRSSSSLASSRSSPSSESDVERPDTSHGQYVSDEVKPTVVQVSYEAEQPDLAEDEIVNKEMKVTPSKSLSRFTSSSSSNDEEEAPKVIASQVSVVVLEKRVAEILTINDDTVVDSRRSSSSSASSKSPSSSESDVERPDTSHGQYVSDEVKPTVVQEVSDEAEQPDLAEDEILNKELKEMPSKSLSRSTSSSSSNDEEEEPPEVTAPQVSVVVLENRLPEILTKDDTVEDSRRSLSSSASSKSPSSSESDVEQPDSSHVQHVSGEVELPVMLEVFYEAEQADLAEVEIVNKEMKEIPSKSLSSSTSSSSSNDEEEAPKVTAPHISVVVLEKRVAEILTIKEFDEAEVPDLTEDKIVHIEMKETPSKSLSSSTSSSSSNDEEEEPPKVIAPQALVVVLEKSVPVIMTIKDDTIMDSIRSSSSSDSSKSSSSSDNDIERPDTSHGQYVSDEVEPQVVQEVEIVSREVQEIVTSVTSDSSSDHDEVESSNVLMLQVSMVIPVKEVPNISIAKGDADISDISDMYSKRSSSSAARIKSTSKSESDEELPASSHGKSVSDEAELETEELPKVVTLQVSTEKEDPNIQIRMDYSKLPKLSVNVSRRSSKSSSSFERDETRDTSHSKLVSDEVEQPVVNEVEIVYLETMEIGPNITPPSSSDHMEELTKIVAPQISMVVLEKEVPAIWTKNTDFLDKTVKDSRKSSSTSASSNSSSTSDSDGEAPALPDVGPPQLLADKPDTHTDKCDDEMNFKPHKMDENSEMNLMPEVAVEYDTEPPSEYNRKTSVNSPVREEQDNTLSTSSSSEFEDELKDVQQSPTIEKVSEINEKLNSVMQTSPASLLESNAMEIKLPATEITSTADTVEMLYTVRVINQPEIIETIAESLQSLIAEVKPSIESTSEQTSQIPEPAVEEKLEIPGKEEISDAVDTNNSDDKINLIVDTELPDNRETSVDIPVREELMNSNEDNTSSSSSTIEFTSEQTGQILEPAVEELLEIPVCEEISAAVEANNSTEPSPLNNKEVRILSKPADDTQSQQTCTPDQSDNKLLRGTYDTKHKPFADVDRNLMKMAALMSKRMAESIILKMEDQTKSDQDDKVIDENDVQGEEKSVSSPPATINMDERNARKRTMFQQLQYSTRPTKKHFEDFDEPYGSSDSDSSGFRSKLQMFSRKSSTDSEPDRSKLNHSPLSDKTYRKRVSSPFLCLSPTSPPSDDQKHLKKLHRCLPENPAPGSVAGYIRKLSQSSLPKPDNETEPEINYALFDLVTEKYIQPLQSFNLQHSPTRTLEKLGRPIDLDNAFDEKVVQNRKHDVKPSSIFMGRHITRRHNIEDRKLAVRPMSIELMSKQLDEDENKDVNKPPIPPPRLHRKKRPKLNVDIKPLEVNPVFSSNISVDTENYLNTSLKEKDDSGWKRSDSLKCKVNVEVKSLEKQQTLSDEETKDAKTTNELKRQESLNRRQSPRRSVSLSSPTRPDVTDKDRERNVWLDPVKQPPSPNVNRRDSFEVKVRPVSQQLSTEDKEMSRREKELEKSNSLKSNSSSSRPPTPTNNQQAFPVVVKPLASQDSNEVSEEITAKQTTPLKTPSNSDSLELVKHSPYRNFSESSSESDPGNVYKDTPKLIDSKPPKGKKKSSILSIVGKIARPKPKDRTEAPLIVDELIMTKSVKGVEASASRRKLVSPIKVSQKEELFPVIIKPESKLFLSESKVNGADKGKAFEARTLMTSEDTVIAKHEAEKRKPLKFKEEQAETIRKCKSIFGLVKSRVNPEKVNINEELKILKMQYDEVNESLSNFKVDSIEKRKKELSRSSSSSSCSSSDECRSSPTPKQSRIAAMKHSNVDGLNNDANVKNVKLSVNKESTEFLKGTEDTKIIEYTEIYVAPKKSEATDCDVRSCESKDSSMKTDNMGNVEITAEEDGVQIVENKASSTEVNRSLDSDTSDSGDEEKTTLPSSQSAEIHKHNLNEGLKAFIKKLEHNIKNDAENENDSIDKPPKDKTCALDDPSIMSISPVECEVNTEEGSMETNTSNVALHLTEQRAVELLILYKEDSVKDQENEVEPVIDSPLQITPFATPEENRKEASSVESDEDAKQIKKEYEKLLHAECLEITDTVHTDEKETDSQEKNSKQSDDPNVPESSATSHETNVVLDEDIMGEVAEEDTNSTSKSSSESDQENKSVAWNDQINIDENTKIKQQDSCSVDILKENSNANETVAAYSINNGVIEMSKAISENDKTDQPIVEQTDAKKLSADEDTEQADNEEKVKKKKTKKLKRGSVSSSSSESSHTETDDDDRDGKEITKSDTSSAGDKSYPGSDKNADDNGEDRTRKTTSDSNKSFQSNDSKEAHVISIDIPEDEPVLIEENIITCHLQEEEEESGSDKHSVGGKLFSTRESENEKTAKHVLDLSEYILPDASLKADAKPEDKDYHADGEHSDSDEEEAGKRIETSFCEVNELSVSVPNKVIIEESETSNMPENDDQVNSPVCKLVDDNNWMDDYHVIAVVYEMDASPNMRISEEFHEIIVIADGKKPTESQVGDDVFVGKQSGQDNVAMEGKNSEYSSSPTNEDVNSLHTVTDIESEKPPDEPKMEVVRHHKAKVNYTPVQIQVVKDHERVVDIDSVVDINPESVNSTENNDKQNNNRKGSLSSSSSDYEKEPAYHQLEMIKHNTVNEEIPYSMSEIVEKEEVSNGERMDSSSSSNSSSSIQSSGTEINVAEDKIFVDTSAMSFDSGEVLQIGIEDAKIELIDSGHALKILEGGSASSKSSYEGRINAQAIHTHIEPEVADSLDDQIIKERMDSSSNDWLEDHMTEEVEPKFTQSNDFEESEICSPIDFAKEGMNMKDNGDDFAAEETEFNGTIGKGMIDRYSSDSSSSSSDIKPVEKVMVLHVPETSVDGSLESDELLKSVIEDAETFRAPLLEDVIKTVSLEETDEIEENNNIDTEARKLMDTNNIAEVSPAVEIKTMDAISGDEQAKCSSSGSSNSSDTDSSDDLYSDSMTKSEEHVTYILPECNIVSTDVEGLEEEEKFYVPDIEMRPCPVDLQVFIIPDMPMDMQLYPSLKDPEILLPDDHGKFNDAFGFQVEMIIPLEPMLISSMESEPQIINSDDSSADNELQKSYSVVKEDIELSNIVLQPVEQKQYLVSESEDELLKNILLENEIKLESIERRKPSTSSFSSNDDIKIPGNNEMERNAEDFNKLLEMEVEVKGHVNGEILNDSPKDMTVHYENVSIHKEPNPELVKCEVKTLRKSVGSDSDGEIDVSEKIKTRRLSSSSINSEENGIKSINTENETLQIKPRSTTSSNNYSSCENEREVQEGTDDDESTKFMIGREKDPSKSEVARLIEQSLEIDRRREELRKHEQDRLKELHDQFKPRDEILEHEHIRHLSEEHEHVRHQSETSSRDSREEDHVDLDESSVEDDVEEPEVDISEELLAGEATPLSMPSVPDSDSSADEPDSKPVEEAYDLTESSPDDISPDVESHALFIKLKEAQCKHAVLEAEITKLKAKLVVLENNETQKRQYEKRNEEMATRLRDMEKSLTNARKEINHYQDMMEGSQGQYIALEKKLKLEYTALEKKYHKAKKLIKEYQQREKDFIAERESLLQQQNEKDHQYDALVKSLKDRIFHLESELGEAQKAAGLPVMLPFQDHAQVVETAVEPSVSMAVKSSPKLHDSGSPVTSALGDGVSVSSESDISATEPHPTDESKLQADIAHPFESIPAPKLLDTSVHRAKAQLAANSPRRPPSKQRSKENEIHSPEELANVERYAYISQDIEELVDAALESKPESGLETWIKHDSDNTVKKSDVRKRRAQQNESQIPTPVSDNPPVESEAQPVIIVEAPPSVESVPAPPPPPAGPLELLDQSDEMETPRDRCNSESGESSSTLSQMSYDPSRPAFRNKDSEIPGLDTVSTGTTGTNETVDTSESSSSASVANKRSKGLLPKLPFKFGGSDRDKRGGVSLVSACSLSIEDPATAGDGGITLISKKKIDTGHDFDGASTISDASSGYMVGEIEQSSYNFSGTPANDDHPSQPGHHTLNQFSSGQITEWNNENVRHWLIGIEMERYAQLFTEKSVTGPQLVAMDSNKLKAIGISNAKDRDYLKKKVKELKVVLEKERKQMEKERKQLEKEQKLREKEQKKLSKKK